MWIKMNKGMVMIECLIGLVAILTAVSIVCFLASLIQALTVLQPIEEMDCYWFNFSHFLVYFPWPEPIVDIAY